VGNLGAEQNWGPVPPGPNLKPPLVLLRNFLIIHLLYFVLYPICHYGELNKEFYRFGICYSTYTVILMMIYCLVAAVMHVR